MGVQSPMDEQNPKGVKVPLEFVIPQNLMTRYATNLMVQFTGYEFIISFFEAYAPPVAGTQEEIQAQIEEMGSVPAVCVARVIVAKERMPDFVRVLQGHVERNLPDSEE